MKHLRVLFCLCSALVVSFITTSCTCPCAKQKSGKVALFNGKNLEGWSYVSADATVPMEKVWSVTNGVLVCQGTPLGAIYRAKPVTDFRLVVEYRWAPGQKPGNSGIFSRITEPLKPLPTAVEVQLQHGNAGDIMGLQGRSVEGGQPRFFEVKAHPVAGNIAGVKAVSRAEKPAGEWNRVEIEAKGGSYTVWINGKYINHASGVENVPGFIGLQSEGGVIEFRRVTLE